MKQWILGGTLGIAVLAAIVTDTGKKPVAPGAVPMVVTQHVVPATPVVPAENLVVDVVDLTTLLETPSAVKETLASADTAKIPREIAIADAISEALLEPGATFTPFVPAQAAIPAAAEFEE